MLQIKKRLFSISLTWMLFLASISAQAGVISNISGTDICDGSGFAVSWEADGNTWNADVSKVEYLNETLPVISVSVSTGEEDNLTSLSNEYFLGTLVDGNDDIQGTTVYLDCSGGEPFTGFVADGVDLYLIETDSSGFSMNIEETGNDVSGENGSGNNGGNGGKGKALDPAPADLVSRGSPADKFPTLDIYVSPSFMNNVGTGNYISRIMQNLALANTIYSQSDLKPIHLLAIVISDEDIGTSSSQGSVLQGLERIRKYTVQEDSADVSMVYSGEIFDQNSLWGWAEIGAACELRKAVAAGKDVSSNKVANKISKSAFAVIDLPTLMQRGWVLAHEMSHTMGGGHIAGDPLSDASFNPDFALKDYEAGEVAKALIFQNCD